METNLVGMWASLSRAYEIALLGGFSIKVVYEPDYIEGADDYKKIKEFFKGAEFSADGDILIQIVKPDIRTLERESETLSDILKRVEVAKGYDIPTKHESDVYKTLLKSAFERLNLSINNKDMINEIAKVIAQLEGSKEIQTVHVAESLHYNMPVDGKLIIAENDHYSFGYGIKIARTDMYEDDIIDAIEYLKSLL